MAEVMITSSFLIVVLVLLRRIWRTKISRRLQYALWLLVAVRLLVPVPLFYNSLNVMNAVRYMADKGEASGQNPDGRIVYHGKPSDKQAENGQDNRSLAEEAVILSEGTDILAEKQVGPENRDGLAAMEAAVKEDGNRLDLKELERALEGGSWINRFFLRGYGRYTWYLGMAVLGIWMTGCNLIFRRRIYRNRVVLGREGRLKVYRAEGIDSPCLFGILWPAVYLTPEAADNPVHKKYAVWHELTHLKLPRVQDRIFW